MNSLLSGNNNLSNHINKIKAGDLFELTSWSSASETLKINLPKSSFSYDGLYAIAQDLYKLKNNKNYTVISDPYLENPTHTIFYNGNKWTIGFPDGKSTDIGNNPSEKDISKLIPAGAKIFISLPPTKDLYNKLSSKFDINSSVELSADASKIQYYLSGRIRNDQLEYTFVLPLISNSDTAFENTLPVRTDYNMIKKDTSSVSEAADSLAESTFKLSKIKSWLTLSGPPDQGNFPFLLGLKDANTNKIITKGTVKKGEDLGLVLLTDTINERYWDRSQRYVYVILIDSKGKVALAYPLSGSIENKLPIKSSDVEIKTGLPLGYKRLITVAAPFGVDTYIMLTTDEPIPDPELFNQEGVITRGDQNGLQQLINIGSKTRGDFNTPANWSIYRLSIKSIP